MSRIFVTVRPITGWAGARTPANARRPQSAFTASWSNTVGLMMRELQHLGADRLVIQADVTEDDIRLDGQLRATANPKDPGVRILFDSKYGPLTYECDSCVFWQHNVRSIALGLEALRAVDRYGINSAKGQQYKGYREIGTGNAPAATEDRSAAIHLLRMYATGVSDSGVVSPEPDADLPVDELYRRARRHTHPDANAGDRASWDIVTKAGKVLGL